MKSRIALLIALIGWFTVVTQFVLMLDNRVASIPETIVRFFSFFTILTNTLVAFYFTCVSVRKFRFGWLAKPGTLTALAVYITMVGLVYQVLLRGIWQPTGMQRLVDELLHSIVPVLTVAFWYCYENARPIRYALISRWMIYPLLYLSYIVVRGAFSGFYPYPFIEVAAIGLKQALLNSAGLLIGFVVLAAGFVLAGKKLLPTGKVG